MTAFFAAPEWRLAIAIAIGLLVGAERQRRTDVELEIAAGIRTHALIALLGGLSALSGSPVITLVAASFVTAGMLLAYARVAAAAPGLTSEVAAVVTFALGYLAMSKPDLAAAAGLAMTILLATRDPLHRFISQALTRRDMLDALTFLVAAFIILPLVPDRAIDPWGLVNPKALWRLAVVLMGLSALGYIAQRSLGARFGLTVAGFVGGFVSTTVAIAAMGARARTDSRLIVPCAAGAVASVVGALVYLFALVAAADWSLMVRLLPAFAGALLPMLAFAGFLSWQGGGVNTIEPSDGRAFDIRIAVFFAGLVAVFALVGKFVTDWLGGNGLLASAAATGLVDVHATSVSIAALTAGDTVALSIGALAVMAALTTNMGIKVPTSFAFGPRGFAVRVSAGLLMLIGGMWAGHAAGEALLR